MCLKYKINKKNCKIFTKSLTNLSISGFTVAKALYPTVGTARPSASVERISTLVGSLFFIAIVILGHFSDSTP